MKIDGQSNSDLLQRMQQMHQEGTEKAERSPGPAKTSSDFSVDAPSAESAAPVAEKKSELASRIETEATRALKGEYSDDAEVREAVIDAVLDERLGGKLNAAEDRRMRGTLKDALVEDPAFMRKVDDMLLLAARDIRPT